MTRQTTREKFRARREARKRQLVDLRGLAILSLRHWEGLRRSRKQKRDHIVHALLGGGKGILKVNVSRTIQGDRV